MAAVAPAAGEEAAVRDEVSKLSSPKGPMAASKNSKDEIMALARNLSDQPAQNLEPDVWGVLIAISKNARRRPQGMNILLSVDTHCLGRCVEDTRFQIGSMAISANHCKLYRSISKLDSRNTADVFLKDTSTNGTYHNWSKLGKHAPEVRLRHGDIISFIALPDDDRSYAFVYQEIRRVTPLENGAAAKRKPEDFLVESKRLKGIGIGAPDGPVSLDDVRSLQRSNTELRQQLESHVITIEELRNQIRSSKSQHENELKKVKETVSSSFVDQIKELQDEVNDKTKDADNFKNEAAALRISVKDLTERLGASMQSRMDADEIIQSQKITVSELESQLEGERNQRKEEREKAASDLNSAIQRAQIEAQDEIKRQRDIHVRQHREQQEVISKLQESEKESRLLVETLRLKLEDARENLVVSEKKVRQLELQIEDNQEALDNSKNKLESLESELNRLHKELESEKVAREEAWAKVSALELEIAAAIRDLSIEKQRFQGARERIILRETQLRAFYSTTEEISALFLKQQEQLKAMQKTLEDDENYEDISIGINLNEPASGILNVRAREIPKSTNAEDDPGVRTPKNAIGMSNSFESGNDDNTSTTQKHDCDMGTQDGNTQDLECTSADRFAKGFDAKSDIAGMTIDPEGEPVETERVLETESPTVYANLDGKHADLQKCSNLVEDTMQLDDDPQVQEDLEPLDRFDRGSGGCSQSKLQEIETTIVRTADLLASEVAGSWAVSTAPSVNGENESPGSVGEAEAGAGDTAAASAAILSFCEGQAEGSQSNANIASKLSNEHKRLTAMIEILAPELKQQLHGDKGGGEKRDWVSDAETEGSANSDTNSEDTGGAVAATATQDDEEEDSMEEGEMIEDSVG